MARPKPAPKRRKRNSGSVFTRGDGRIGCVLPSRLDPARRPVYTSPITGRAWKSEAEAAAWLDAELEARKRPAPTPQPGDEPLGAYCWRWWTAGSRLWPSRTARAYRRALSLILGVNDLDAVPVGKLSHDAVRSALGALVASTWHRARRDGTPTTAPKPYSRRSVQQARMVLGMALSDLVPDVLAANPVRRVHLPREQPPEQPVWDGDQAARFIEAAERIAPHLALAYRLILRRALRQGECLALQWRDVDERRGVLVVERTAGERVGEAGDTKGRKRRELPLSADLLKRLELHRTTQSILSPWVFANPETGLPYHPRALLWWIPKICRHAGVPVIHPKDMRATCATNLLEEGVPLPVVAAILGHSSIAVTSQHYARALKRREERIARMADALDDALDRSAVTARGERPTLLEEERRKRV